MTRVLSLLLLSLSAFVGRAENSQTTFDDEARTFLMQRLGFTDNDLQKVEKGGVAHQCVVSGGPGDLVVFCRRDDPTPVVGRPEQSGEARTRIESRKAQPVD